VKALEAVADLDRRFGIAGKARVISGNGGLPKVVVSTANARGEMYFHGAHVTSWAPRDADEVFFLSPNSFWQDGHAIRGGVPVSFPWFGDKADDSTAPAHGFVRLSAWQLESIELVGDDVAVSMFTESGEETRRWWPVDFRLLCQATFGIQLKIELAVTNTGVGSFSFEEALHSYFRVGNVETVSVQGLDSTRYIDKTNRRIEMEKRGELRVTSETDSVYLNTNHELKLMDPTLKRQLTVHKENSQTTVVWNPWAEKSQTLSDLGRAQWKNFICIESSNVDPYVVHLDSGQRHTLATRFQVAPWPTFSSSAGGIVSTP
jgi:glucose-6-phosphate 1-epimerase